MATISAVVPMFNEEDRIADTLDALLAQTRPLDEIIVVDNASADDSASIVAGVAAQHPEVRLIREEVPGCFAARNAGYDAASGDIIARTDAETLVDNGWAEAINGFFERTDRDEFAAVTGPTLLYDAPPFEFIDRFARKIAPEGSCGAVHGPNHALRGSAWKVVRQNVTQRQDVWEDVDLSLALSESGFRMYFNPAMMVSTSIRALRRSPVANWHYITGGLRTARARGGRRARVAMALDLPIRAAAFTGMWALFRPWDELSQTWKPQRLFQPLKDGHTDVTASR